jgi:hypothetical protein
MCSAVLTKDWVHCAEGQNHSSCSLQPVVPWMKKTWSQQFQGLELGRLEETCRLVVLGI